MKKQALTGLVMLLPLTLTIWIISSIISWLTDPFVGIAEAILSAIGLSGVRFLWLGPDQVLFMLSHFLVLAFLVGFILLIGTIGHHIVVSYLIRWGDGVIQKIPVVSSIYKTSQDLIQTVLATDNKAFKQVVLVQYPHNECWAIGLVAKEGLGAPDLIPVFVPTTPNPTSGFLLMYEKKRVIPLQMTVEEAFRYIISCGVLISPNALSTLSFEHTKN